MTPTLIESSSALDELILNLANETVIAVDTEFFRETTYYPKLALVQIATDSIVACIDPIAFDAKPGLKKILCNEEITKIFHSCSQDLEVLFYYLDEVPKTIYDTQLANAFLTSNHQVGYAALVGDELDVQLDKSQTRTNWLQRPLTPKQIQYAGDDVLYLYQLHTILEKKLTTVGRKSWFDEESINTLPKENSFQLETKKLWKRVKGASRLSRDKLAIVQAMAIWREKVAQQKNITRKRALPDNTIIQLTIDTPVNSNALNNSMTPQIKISNEDQQQLFDSINTAQQSAKESWPDNRFTVLSATQKQLLKDLQRLVLDKSEELEISSALLCSKKDLEQLILLNTEQTNNAEQLPLNITQGWRLTCIGSQLTEVIKKSN